MPLVTDTERPPARPRLALGAAGFAAVVLLGLLVYPLILPVGVHARAQMLEIRGYVAGDPVLESVPAGATYRRAPLGFESHTGSLRLGPVAYTFEYSDYTALRRQREALLMGKEGGPPAGRSDRGTR